MDELSQSRRFWANLPADFVQVAYNELFINFFGASTPVLVAVSRSQSHYEIVLNRWFFAFWLLTSNGGLVGSPLPVRGY